ncbi:MAG: hypothetical protein COB50_02120 [Thiotrichales bacterium]|nr:MAG: hypothetical protein COB50_02120 [Thiotrichales bacterium]
MTKHLSQNLKLFSIPAWRNLVVSCLLSNISIGITYILMSWIVLKVDNQVSSVAILMICLWTPNVLLSFFAGTIIDSWNKKHLLLLSAVLRCIALIILSGLAFINLSTTEIYSVAILFGISFSIYSPTTIAMIRDIIPDDKLIYANTTLNSVYEVGLLLGTGLSGALLGLLTIPGALVFTSVIAIAATVFTWLIPHQHSAGKLSESMNYMWQDLISCIKYLAGSKFLICLYIAQLFIMAGFMTAPILLAPFAKNILHASAAEFGYMEAMLSLGVVIASLVNPYLIEKFNNKTVLIMEILILAISFAFFSYNKSITLALAYYLFAGIGFSVWAILLTVAQQHTKASFQGRIMAIFNSLSGIVILAFYFIIMLTSSYVSIATMYWLEVGFAIATLSMVLLNLRKIK